jgi:hypothetical protein
VSGKWYFEVTVKELPALNAQQKQHVGLTNRRFVIGVSDKNFHVMSNQYQCLGDTRGGWGCDNQATTGINFSFLIHFLFSEIHEIAKENSKEATHLFQDVTEFGINLPFMEKRFPGIKP